MLPTYEQHQVWDRRISRGSSSTGRMAAADQLSHKVADWRSRISRAAASPVNAPAATSSSRLPQALACSSSSPAVLRQPTYSVSRSSSSYRSTVSCRASSASHSPLPAHPSPAHTADPASLQTPGTVSPAAASLSVGQVVEIECERLGTAGVGVCLWGPSRLVLLVQGALPGERLTAVITAVKKSYAEANKTSTLEAHRHAAVPACQHYGTCGGCSLQALSYQAQLVHKVDYVAQILTRLAKLDGSAVQATQLPPVAADAEYGYRNKVQLAFSSLVWQRGCLAQEQEQQEEQGGGCAGQQGQVVQGWGLGYYLPGSNSVVVPVQECSLASVEMNAVIAAVRRLCQEHGLQPHNSPQGSGVLRHLIIRSAAATAAAPGTAAAPSGSASHAAALAVATAGRRLMAVLVTTRDASSQPQTLQALSAVAEGLMAMCPQLASVIHSIEAPAVAGASSAGSRSHSKSKAAQNNNGRSGAGNRAAPDSSSSSSRGAQALRVQSSRVLAGASSLMESLCGLQFQLSPHSFFQTNTAQAEKLYQLVVQAVADVVGQPVVSAADPAFSTASAAACSTVAVQDDASVGQVQQRDAAGCIQPLMAEPAGAVDASGAGGGVILDLYCGTGTIALCLAAALPQQVVVGFDVSASSIADAEANAMRNGLGNVEFVCGDLNQLLPAGQAQAQQLGKKPRSSSSSRPKGMRQGQSLRLQHTTHTQRQQVQLQKLTPRVVVVDPARAGLGPGVVQYLLTCAAQRVVYVSCNAATQARDLQLLCDGGVFALTSWTCVDLFPQTSIEHVETVVVLDRVAN